MSLNLKALVKMAILLKNKPPKLKLEESKAWVISLESVKCVIPKKKVSDQFHII